MKKGLGRGLNSLFGEYEEENSTEKVVETKIEQVIVNILDNAVEHAEGMTELRLKVSVEGGKAVFEISDNGCGIEAERLKTIFTGYGGGTSSTDTKINSGIGLSVCATIIKAHGGEIFAESPANSGAVFSFSLSIEENYDE